MRWLVILILSVGLATALSRPATAEPAPPSARATLSLELAQVKLEAIPLSVVMDHLTIATHANFHVNWKALEAAGIARDTPISMHVRKVPVRKMLSLLVDQLQSKAALTFYADQGVIELTTRELADKKLVTQVYNIEDLLMIYPNLDPNELSQFGGLANGNNSSSGNTSSRNSNTGSNSNTRSNNANRGSNQRSASSSTPAGGTNSDLQTREGRMEAVAQLIRDTVEPAIWKENGGPATIRTFQGNLVVTAPHRIHELIGGD